MRIIAIAQVEDKTNLEKQIAKQTIQPQAVIYYVDESPAVTIRDRRQRIAKNHQKLIDVVTRNRADLVWQLEGDVELPNNCLEQLLCDYEKLKGNDFGYISGVQVGRHGLYCLGAWYNFTPTSFESIDHKLTGIQEVEATGFYCLLAPRHTWLSGKANWEGEPWGPDVNWARSIKGKKYVNMDICIGHITKSGIIWPTHQSTTTAKFYKKNNKWEYQAE